MASRIAVMNHGEMQQFAAPDTVYNRPANLFVARFLGTPPMNTVPARLARARWARGRHRRRPTGRDPPAAAAAVRHARAPMPIAMSCSGCARNVSARPGARLAGTPATPIEARVEVIEPTGAETVCCSELAGARMRARIAPDVRLNVGELARFAVDTRRICLFDPETERLIA